MQLRVLGKTGLHLSKIGFGASPLGNVFGEISESEATRAVHEALDSGINFFDTAPYYGHTLSETRLGVALRTRRPEAVIATKCGRYGAEDFDFSARRVHRSIDESLSRLATDYVDILHVHDIEFGDRRQIIDETVPALREIQRSGKARFIGITGLSLRMLREVAEAVSVDVILSYCRYNLLNRELSAELAPFCKRHGIGLINASPLHMGLLANGGPPAWHPAPEPVRRIAAQVVTLCRKRNVDPAALAVQFALGSPDVDTTLVGVASAEQLQDNIRAASTLPDSALLAEVEALVKPVAEMMWITGKPENH